jgi:hypothetical protein
MPPRFSFNTDLTSSVNAPLVMHKLASSGVKLVLTKCKKWDGSEGLLWSNCVPMKFPRCSHHISNMFPKFLIYSLIRSQWHLSFYSLFGHGSTSMHISFKEGGWGRGGRGSMTKPSFILDREACLGSYVGECPMFQKYW